MKQLEIEYKNAISLEVPDLWNRIEAGIDEYEATKKTDNISYIKEETAKEKKTNKINTKKVIAYIGRFSAAAVCLILAMGAFRLIGGSNKAASEAPAMADSAASEASYDAAPAVAEYADSEMEAEESFDSSYSMSEAAAEATAEESDDHSREGQKKATSYKGETNSLQADSVAVFVVPVESLKAALDCDEDEAKKIIMLLPANGIKGAYDFKLAEDDEPDSEAVKEIEGIGDDTIRISFVDEEDSRYLMYCNRNTDETITVLAVIRDDEKIFEILP
jgi:hypothetical protein